jgi:hypothetical protein
MKRPLLSVMILAGVLCTSVAVAQSPEDTYVKLHEAIAIKAKCDGVSFSQEQFRALEHAAEAKAGGLLGAGVSLKAIEAAKRSTAVINCGTPAATELLGLYDKDLASAVM